MVFRELKIDDENEIRDMSAMAVSIVRQVYYCLQQAKVIGKKYKEVNWLGMR